jgi:hypothetical protein
MATQRHRVALQFASVSLILVGLSGCGVTSPIWVSGQADDLRIRVCASAEMPVSFDRMSVSTRTRWPSQSIDSEVWLATSESPLDLVDSAQFSFGTPPEGFSDQLGPVLPDIASQNLYVALTKSDEQGHTIEAQAALFDGNSIRDDEWVNEAGNHSADPCKP